MTREICISIITYPTFGTASKRVRFLYFHDYAKLRFEILYLF